MDETPIKAGRAGPGKMNTDYYRAVYGELDEVCFPYFESRRHEHVQQALGLVPFAGGGAAKRRLRGLPHRSLALKEQAGLGRDSRRTVLSAASCSRTGRRGPRVFGLSCASRRQLGRREAFGLNCVWPLTGATSGQRKWRTTAEIQGSALMNKTINALPAHE